MQSAIHGNIMDQRMEDVKAAVLLLAICHLECFDCRRERISYFITRERIHEDIVERIILSFVVHDATGLNLSRPFNRRVDEVWYV